MPVVFSRNYAGIVMYDYVIILNSDRATNREMNKMIFT